MSDEFVNIPGAGVSDPDDRPNRANRRNVRLFLLGLPKDVKETNDRAKCTLEQYHQMIAAGILDDQKVELLNGICGVFSAS